MRLDCRWNDFKNARLIRRVRAKRRFLSSKGYRKNTEKEHGKTIR